MRKGLVIFSLLLVGVATVIGGFSNKGFTKHFSKTTASPIEKILDDYQSALDIVKDNYVGDSNYERLTESSIQGMLWTLDPHSSFFNQDEYRKLKEEQSSSFVGIGVSILRHTDGVYVQAVVEGTPAEKAGLRYGDRITAVDGEDAREWDSNKVSSKVRGERDKPVKLTIERAGAKDPIELVIIRNAVPLPSIRNYFMVRQDVGYIGLTGGFQQTTDEELDEAIASLKKKGMKQLILDLRGNPGGILGQAIEVSSRFIPQGQVIASVKGRTEYPEPEFYKSKSGTQVEDFPLVVLINHNSASASEIVSGAIQDHGRGLLVGQKSFGKGLVQHILALPFGTGMTLTTARYYTPFGRSLQRDYSNGSIYDYYTHQDESETSNDKEKNQNDTKPNSAPTPSPTPTPKGPAVKTAGGRTLYGGDGITPDINVKPLEITPLRNRIAEAAFYFTRQLAAGEIQGLENYRVTKTNPNHELKPTEYPVTEQMVEAFNNFINKDTLIRLKSSQIGDETAYVKYRLRLEIVTAAYGNDNSNHVLIENDPQVLRAIEELPNSKNLSNQIMKKAQIG